MFAYYLTQCSSVDISLSFLSDGEHVKVGTFQMFLAGVHLWMECWNISVKDASLTMAAASSVQTLSLGSSGPSDVTRKILLFFFLAMHCKVGSFLWWCPKQRFRCLQTCHHYVWQLCYLRDNWTISHGTLVCHGTVVEIKGPGSYSSTCVDINQVFNLIYCKFLPNFQKNT